MPLARIELADEFLHHFPRYPFDWSIGVTFEMTGIGAHDLLPLSLRDFIFPQIEWLTNGDLMERLLVWPISVGAHHELAGWNAHQLHTNAVAPCF